MMKFIHTLASLAAAMAISVAAADANEHSGTWKVNSAKSKYSPGPGPKNLTETIALDRDRYKVQANGTAADGKTMHIEFDAKFDGKDYPMIGVPWADMVSVKWIDVHTPQMIQKKDGQVTITINCRVSGDGKIRTCTLKGRDEQGRSVDDLVVFDKKSNHEALRRR